MTDGTFTELTGTLPRVLIDSDRTRLRFTSLNVSDEGVYRVGLSNAAGLVPLDFVIEHQGKICVTAQPLLVKYVALLHNICAGFVLLFPELSYTANYCVLWLMGSYGLQSHCWYGV